MRKTKTVSLAAVALAAAALVAGVSSAGGESGPACADITAETHNYSYNSGTATYTLGVNLLLPTGVSACRSITYTLIVSGVTGAPIVVSQKGSTELLASNFADGDNKVCISATTSSGGHIHDAAPSAGCLEISLGTTGGGSGFS